MRIRQEGEFPFGYTSITGVGGPVAEMRMDFGILRLRDGESYAEHAARERAFLLIGGRVLFEADGLVGGSPLEAARASMLEQPPAVLHVPPGARVRISAEGGGAELSVHGAESTPPARFPPRLIRPEEVRVQRLAAVRFAGSTERILRTALDGEADPHAGLALGEVITPPGRWSSYPPHHHPHPEIYHYRFFPPNGFGFAGEGERVYRVGHRDTAAIFPNRAHPQAAAPGYTMLTIWAIPHLAGDRFRAGSRIFLPEHAWVLEGS